MKLPRAILDPLARILIRRGLRRPPDFVIGDRSNPYLRRWWLIPRNRIVNAYLHEVLRDDDDRALHDHPWPSCSVILRGGYYEELPVDGSGEAARQRITARRWRAPGSVTFRRASAPHRLITHRDRQPDGSTIPRVCWSLFLTGPRLRTWGFWCSWGWRPWREFVNTDDPGQPGRGCG